MNNKKNCQASARQIFFKNAEIIGIAKNLPGYYN